MGDSLVADAGLALEALCAAVKPSGRKAPNFPHRVAAPAKSDPPTAEALYAALAGVRPDDLVIAEETPSNLAVLHKHFPVRQRSGFFTMASGGLGFGLPGSIGVALGEQASGRNRRVLSVVGDGSFQYSIQSLATSAQEKARVTVVVPSNSEYAILKAFAKEEDTPGVPGLDLPPLDVVSLARGYGCRAEQAGSADEAADLFKASLDHDGPTVIAVPIDRMVPPLI